MTNSFPSTPGSDDWLDALLHADRAEEAPAIADDGFSDQVLLRIAQTRAARSGATAVGTAPAAALARQRAMQRDALRSARWTRAGSIAGALLAAGTLAAVDGPLSGTPSWLAGLALVALSTALTAWALLQDAMG